MGKISVTLPPPPNLSRITDLSNFNIMFTKKKKKN